MGGGPSTQRAAATSINGAGVRADKTPEGGSVGLGMSICKQLVDLMGGRIWLHSELGHGTRVLVQISLGHAEKADGGGADLDTLSPFGSVSAAGAQPSVPLGQPPRRERLEVLLVEDNDYNVDVAKQMLEVT
jgi:hypothetical protein